MLNLDRVKEAYDSYICRSCMNKEYHVNLEPKECKIGYIGPCPCCRETKRIVVGLSGSGKRKMWFK